MKATLVDGTVLEGQPAEIAEAMREFASRGSGGNSPRTPVSGAPQSTSSTIWTEARVRALWDFLYGRQKELLRFLVKQGGSATLEEVIRELGLKKGSELAGLRCCITRNARRETGYKKAELITWARTPKGTWHYKVEPDAYSTLRQLV